MDSDTPICIVNPDVRIPDPLTMHHLHEALRRDPSLGAVAPSIRTAAGHVEYTGSTLRPDPRLGRPHGDPRPILASGVSPGGRDGVDRRRLLDDPTPGPSCGRDVR